MIAPSAEVGAVLDAGSVGCTGSVHREVGLHPVDMHTEEVVDETALGTAVARLFRGVAARLIYMGPTGPICSTPAKRLPDVWRAP